MIPAPTSKIDPIPKTTLEGKNRLRLLPPEHQLGWETRSLHRLPPAQQEVVVELMRAWLQGEAWSPPGGADWPVLWQYLERTGLSGIAGDLALQGLAGSGACTQEAIERNLSNSLYHEQVVRIAHRTARVAAGRGLGVVIMKGPALVAQAYGDGGARPYNDLDVFMPDRKQALALLDALGQEEEYPWSRLSWSERLAEAEYVKCSLDGWQMEIAYGVEYAGEAQFMFLNRWRSRLMPVPEPADRLLNPDPSLHMVYLIMHMSLNHLFTRLMWFLDLAVLARSKKAEIDWELVQTELRRLGLANAGHAASRWCAQNLAPSFPVLEPRLPAWNYSLLGRITSTQAILDGTFQVYHRAWWQFLWQSTFGVLGFVLVSDPGPGGGPWGSSGIGFSLNRFRMACKVDKPIKPLDRVLTLVFNLLMAPCAQLFAWAMGRERPARRD